MSHKMAPDGQIRVLRAICLGESKPMGISKRGKVAYRGVHSLLQRCLKQGTVVCSGNNDNRSYQVTELGIRMVMLDYLVTVVLGAEPLRALSR